MKKDDTLEKPLLIEPKIFEDERGWFYEAYNSSDFITKISFVQDNHSYSLHKGTIRGLHLQKSPFEQSKLIRVLKGRIMDVVVDLRQDSKSYLKVSFFELDYLSRNALYIPKGFAHGFITIEDHTEVYYKVDHYYSKEHELTISFDDSTLKIDWPSFDKYYVSQKDKNGLSLEQVLTLLKP